MLTVLCRIILCCIKLRRILSVKHRPTCVALGAMEELVVSKKPYFAVAAVVAFAGVSSCYWDTVSDQKIRVACIGDSNVASVWGNWCTNLARKYKNTKDETAAENTPAKINFLFSNYARGGAVAAPNSSVNDAPAQLARALYGGSKPADGQAAGYYQVCTPRPGEATCIGIGQWDLQPTPAADVVILSIGSNDMHGATYGDEAWASIEKLKNTAESVGRVVFVATVPYQYEFTRTASDPIDAFVCKNPKFVRDGAEHDRNLQIGRLNQLIRQKVAPSRVLDFDSWVGCNSVVKENWDASNTTYRYGIHMTPDADKKRLEIAQAVVQAASAEQH
jgi:hypothetical protein